MDGSRRKSLESAVRVEAKKLVSARVSVAEFSARIFGPDGLLRQFWRSEDQRRAVVASALYRDLRDQMAILDREEVRAFDADVERLSGRLTVVVPKSLHAALRAEAEREGVSLSELIRLKLGVPYRLTAQWIARGRRQSEAA